MSDEILNYRHIVFGVEHYNPLGLIRSLGEYGIRPIFIVINDGSVRPFASKSKYISDIYPVASIEEGYHLLLQKTFDNKKCFLYTADDQTESYLDCHYEALNEKYYFFNAGASGVITRFMDKKAILDCAERHGFNVLKAQIVQRGGEIPDDIEYPVITKAITPTIGNWKADSHICNDEDELRSAYNNIQSQNVLIQKYIRKKNELCLDGISVNNGQDVLVTIASNYNYVLRDTYSPYMKVFNFRDEEMLRKLKHMFGEIGFEGIYSVEFLIDQDGQYYFTEINFRNSTWSYASTVLGMNLPAIWADSMLKGKVEDGLVRDIPDDTNAVVEIPDFKYRVSNEKMSVWKWLKSVKQAKCRYMMGRKDAWPMLYFILCRVFKPIRRNKR